MALWRVEIVGWLPWDPEGAGIEYIAAEMWQGDGICTRYNAEAIEAPTSHPEWDLIEEFFQGDDDEF